MIGLCKLRTVKSSNIDIKSKHYFCILKNLRQKALRNLYKRDYIILDITDKMFILMCILSKFTIKYLYILQYYLK